MTDHLVAQQNENLKHSTKRAWFGAFWGTIIPSAIYSIISYTSAIKTNAAKATGFIDGLIVTSLTGALGGYIIGKVEGNKHGRHETRTENKHVQLPSIFNWNMYKGFVIGSVVTVAVQFLNSLFRTRITLPNPFKFSSNTITTFTQIIGGAIGAFVGGAIGKQKMQREPNKRSTIKENQTGVALLDNKDETVYQSQFRANEKNRRIMAENTHNIG